VRNDRKRPATGDFVREAFGGDFGGDSVSHPES
jgi:hypothetical protein